MKQTTLEDLYYGNINPNEISFVKGFEYMVNVSNVMVYIGFELCMDMLNFRADYDKIN